MEQDTTSFWHDIKKYEDILATDQTSYCFAQLAELYHKLGLTDDALTVARKGCEVHPEFVTGCLTLARICLDKGLKDEGRKPLEKVVAATPENRVAMNMLIRLYMDLGEFSAAEKALRTALYFNPDEPEHQALLQSLTKTFTRQPAESETVTGLPAGENEVEELFVLSEADVVDEFTAGEELTEVHGIEEIAAPEETFASATAAVPAGVTGGDPLATGTLAELYVSQGFIDRALGVYRELLQKNPFDTASATRVKELEEALAREAAGAAAVADVAPLAVTSAAGEVLAPAGIPEGLPPAPHESPLETLERWLQNIARRRN
jgi:tetratricopeptide (TPR) repeat protein